MQKPYADLDPPLRIEKYRLDELGKMLQSPFWDGQDHIPITPYRIESYLNNPRADRERPVLYLLIKESQMLAYRSILSDQVHIGGQKLPIGWFSGNWTHPDHRRKGYSTLLLDAVHEDWGEFLFFSNYAPASKQVLDQSHTYEIFHTLKGNRCYFKFALGKLLAPKSSFFRFIQPGLSGLDRILNSFISGRKPIPSSNGMEWEYCPKIGQEEMEFIAPFNENVLFRRDTAAYNWIIQFPWIKSTEQAKSLAKKYHFSAYASSFKLQFYRLKLDNKIEGLILISIRDGIMKVPYAYLNPVAITTAIRHILSLAYNENVLHLTVFHQGLIKELNKFKRFYLFRKEFSQAFLANSELIRQFPGIAEKEVQKGDGDAVFT